MKRLDLTGRRFTRLTALKRVENASNGKPQWLCRCDCGEEKVVRSNSLLQGHTKSCGCMQRESGAAHAPLAAAALIKHGMSKTRLDRIFKGMVSRCYNPKCHAYGDYGARGITICDEWMQDRSKFFSWALANGYDANLTIDRKNNDLGYSPDNCRWSTQRDQSNNTRRNRMLRLGDIEKTVAQWARRYGIPMRTLWARLDSGWSDEQAITTPLMKKGATK